MPVNCKTCKLYLTSLVAKRNEGAVLEGYPCKECADLKGRKSFYAPIKHIPKDKQRELYFGQLPGP
ncbi:hypothetical protein ES705_38088 [subsurface metagenome]